MPQFLAATVKRSRALLLRGLERAASRRIADPAATDSPPPPTRFDGRRQALWKMVSLPADATLAERVIAARAIDDLVAATKSFDKLRSRLDQQESYAREVARKNQTLELARKKKIQEISDPRARSTAFQVAATSRLQAQASQFTLEQTDPNIAAALIAALETMQSRAAILGLYLDIRENPVRVAATETELEQSIDAVN